MKARKQVVKDYIAFPALSAAASALASAASGRAGIALGARSFKSTLAANFTANIVRNVWAYSIIFCGHFPDQTYTFSQAEVAEETRGGWYVRQLLGSANIDGGPLFHLLAGNLSFQVEHHLYPDMPSSRYSEIAPRVRDICRRYGLPYNTGPAAASSSAPSTARSCAWPSRAASRAASPGPTGRIPPERRRTRARRLVGCGVRCLPGLSAGGAIALARVGRLRGERPHRQLGLPPAHLELADQHEVRGRVLHPLARGLRAEQHVPAALGHALQPRGRVRRVADRRVLDALLGADVAGHHRAAVQAHAHREPAARGPARPATR